MAIRRNIIQQAKPRMVGFRNVDNARVTHHHAGVFIMLAVSTSNSGFAMPEPISLTSLLLGAAAACGTALVEEATKDAYAGLKAKVIELFGARAGRSVGKLEDVSTRDEGKLELDQSIGASLSPEEATELEPFIQKMLSALREDQAARDVAHARIGLDLDVGGDALLRNIQWAREIAVKAVTKGDFTLEDIRMDTGNALGKLPAR